MIIDGKELSSRLKAGMAERVVSLRGQYGRVPVLTVILVGENPASQSYVRGKIKSAGEVGIDSRLISMPESVSESELLDTIARLNGDAGGERNPRPTAVAAAYRRGQGHRRHFVGEGRGRIPPAQCRPTVARHAVRAAVYAEGSDAYARRLRHRDRGQTGCRRRTQQYRRTADGETAAQRQCDCNDCPFAGRKISPR